MSGASTESEAMAAAHSAAAAEQAMARLAYEEAASWYVRAVELYRSSGEDGPRRTCELLVRQGEAAKAAGRASHREVLLEAGRLAKTLGDAGLCCTCEPSTQPRRPSGALGSYCAGARGGQLGNGPVLW